MPGFNLVRLGKWGLRSVCTAVVPFLLCDYFVLNAHIGSEKNVISWYPIMLSEPWHWITQMDIVTILGFVFRI